MQSHQLQKSKVVNRRVGRGGKRGSVSGRGIKGQKARAGRRVRPQIRDIIKKIHKRRGFGKNRAASVNPSNFKPAIVNLFELERAFKSGDKITSKTLVEAGLVKRKGDKMPKIKILGSGKLTKKLIFDKSILMSGPVRAKLEK